MVKEKVVKVSKRYIRLILPDEAKKTKFNPTKKNTQQFETEVFEDEEENGEEVKLVPPNNKISIPTAYDIKDAESEELHDLPGNAGDNEQIANTLKITQPNFEGINC